MVGKRKVAEAVREYKKQRLTEEANLGLGLRLKHTENKSLNKDGPSWSKGLPGSLVNSALPKRNTWNTKLVSWNVNGLRAWIKKNGLQYLIEEAPDILGIQETKCSLLKLPSEVKISGYFTHWSPGEKEGYGGSGLYSKNKPISVSLGIGVKSHDNEGRVITAEYEKFYFITTYVPNSGDGLKYHAYRHKEWDPAFLDYLKKLESMKPIILCGDFSVAHKEIDLANPKLNHKTAGFTDEERSGFTKLLADANLVDTFRELYPDRARAYTFWSQRSGARLTNAGWRLDYFLVSRRLMDSVVDHEIRCGVLGSDHCPIVLYLNL